MSTRFPLLFTFLLVFLFSAQLHAEQPYVLNPGDKVKIFVVGEDDLSLEATITTEQTIYYPLIGEIEVSGLTPEQLEKLLTDKLAGDYLINPQVSVTVVGYQQFFIEGEVRSPGSYQYVPDITVRQAIALAGGFTELAAKSRIYIIRGDDPDGKEKKVTLADPIYPGDILTIDESFF